MDAIGDGSRPTAGLTAVMADLHGNLIAVQTVLSEIAGLGVDSIVIAGDVAWGPQPAETIALVRSLSIPVTIIQGNADREVAVPSSVAGDVFLRESTAWCAEQVGAAGRAWLAALQLTATFRVDGVGDVLVCHGSPRSDTDQIRPETDPATLESWLAECSEPLVICGHTHLQFDRTAGRHRIVNPGSIGLHVGVDGAQWALIGPGGVELRTTAYDRERAAALTRTSGIPEAEGFAAFMLDPTRR